MAQRLGPPRSLTPAPDGEGAPAIPFVFDPPGSHCDTAHLKSDAVSGGHRITWPLIDKSIFVPADGDRHFINLKKIEADNPRLKIHGMGGFSLGDYHEFFLFAAPAHRASRFGRVEASFGEGSPLLACMFWGVYYEKYWGEWSGRTCLRITGCSREAAELYVIAALLEYEKEVGVLPQIMQIDLDFLLEDELDVETAGRGVVSAPPAVIDLEPLRFFMTGLTAEDDETACLSFYRVLEYYAFAQQAAGITDLRRDRTINDAEFTRRALQLASREEKEPLFRLLSEITTPPQLDSAVSGGLISEPRQDRLNAALYAFRNSMVHGKFASAFTLRSQSILEADLNGQCWRALLRDLAGSALRDFGEKA